MGSIIGTVTCLQMGGDFAFTTIDDGAGDSETFILWHFPGRAAEFRRRSTRTHRGRIAAIDALGRLHAEQSVEAIVRFAEHPSAHVRKTVARALFRIGGARADAQLRVMAEKDPTDWVRSVARKQLDAKLVR